VSSADFYHQHVARHSTEWSRWGSAVGDPLVLAAVLAIARRRVRLGMWLLGSGLSVMLLGHLAEGTLETELRSVAADPWESFVAEARFLVDLWRAGPPRFDVAA
jgi:2-hydroxy-palmitic acid dioxygenase Mpo1-like protein